MSRPDPYRSAALAASSALSTLAATRAALARPGLMGRGARLVLDQDRKNAINALGQLAGMRIEIDGAPYQATRDGAQLLAENVRNGRDEAMHMPAQTLRNWAEQPSEALADAPGIIDLGATEEPWILVDVGDPQPYWAGIRIKSGQPWTDDLSLAMRHTSEADAFSGLCPAEQGAYVAVPLSAAERAAYPNGKPGAPRGDVAAPAAPASPPPVAEAAQAPTVGERIAVEIWDGPTWSRADGVPRFTREIDAAIAQAVAIVKDGADECIAELRAEVALLEDHAASLRADVDTLTESRAVALRDLARADAALTGAGVTQSVLRRKLAQERTDNAAAWNRVVNFVTYESRRIPIAEDLGDEKKG